LADLEQRLLVTGASGRLAQRVVEIALKAVPPQRLILVSRNRSALERFARRGASVRFGDFSDPASLRAAFAGAERMLLVSATDLSRRTEQHIAAIDAAVAAGVRHVIYTSGLSPAPPNPAAVAPSHYATEQRLASTGLAWTVLRNSLYADYQAAEAARAIESGALVHNFGDGKVAYVAREDCAAAAAAVLTGQGHENAIYDITGPHAYGAHDLARLYGSLAGKTIEAVELDDAALIDRLVGEAGGDDHLKYGAELVASFGRSIREGFMASCTDSVRRLTGRPARTLSEVLQPAFT
jgi:NAD(P)H dehydrogenase (quinone)